MRCKQEMFIKGEYFHIYNRAVHNELLFRDDDDYEYFLKKFITNLERIPTSIVSYCLMPNHFHFFKLFDSSFRPYVIHYNSKYQRKGTLFQGPLQHILVKSNSYFVQLCRYIHFNPKKAGLVNNLSDWKYSNYHAWIDKENSNLFNSEFQKMFKENFENYGSSIQEYEKYLADEEFKRILFLK